MNNIDIFDTDWFACDDCMLTEFVDTMELPVSHDYNELLECLLKYAPYDIARELCMTCTGFEYVMMEREIYDGDEMYHRYGYLVAPHYDATYLEALNLDMKLNHFNTTYTLTYKNRTEKILEDSNPLVSIDLEGVLIYDSITIGSADACPELAIPIVMKFGLYAWDFVSMSKDKALPLIHKHFVCLMAYLGRYLDNEDYIVLSLTCKSLCRDSAVKHLKYPMFIGGTTQCDVAPYDEYLMEFMPEEIDECMIQAYTNAFSDFEEEDYEPIRWSDPRYERLFDDSYLETYNHPVCYSDDDSYSID